MSTARQEFRRLRRSSDRKVIAGLCAGVGRELRIDPIVLRVLLCLLAVYSVVGLLLYLAGWLLIPMADRESARSARTQRWRFVIVMIVVLIGLLAVPWWGLGWHNISLALLALLGLYVLVRRESPTEQGTPNETASGTGSAAGDSAGPSNAHTSAPPAGSGPSAGSRPVTTSPPRWPHRPAPSGEDAVHTMPIPTGWSESGTGPPGRTGQQLAGSQPAGSQPGDQPDAGREQDQQHTEAAATSWRRFEPAPPTFWEQSDPLGLRETWMQPDPLGLLHEDDQSDESVRAGNRGGAYADARVGDTTTLPANAAATTDSGEPKRRGRFLLPLFTLLGVVAATGAVGSSDADPPLSAYVAASLGVIGLGLLVGTWVGRSVTLIVLGILCSIALVPATITDLVRPEIANRDYGSIHRSPTSVEQIAPSYDLGAGEIRLDLTKVPFADGDTVRTAVELGTGQVVVVLPPDVDVELGVDVGAGDAKLFGKGREVWGHNQNSTDLGRDGKGGGTLELQIDSGFGEVEVRRGAR